VSAVDFRRTRYPELGYAEIERNCWRIVATEDGQCVGPFYRTKFELMADLGNYAKQYGCEEVTPMR